LYTLPLSDVDLLLVLAGRGSHALLDLTGHCEESLFDVGCILGRGFEKWDPKAVSEFLSYLLAMCSQQVANFASEYLCNSVFDHLFVRHIALVADQELVDTLCRISVDLL
jgi:hypothetical protein